MKLRFAIAAAFAIIALSCSPKIAQPTSQVAPVRSTDEISSDSALAEGKNLFQNSCARCHDLPKPVAFTKDQWHPILIKMQRKARLDDVAMEKVSNYIFSELK